MRHTLTFEESLFEKLTEHLFSNAETEGAAYLLCNIARGSNENRLLVTDFIPVTGEDLDSATRNELVIKQSSYLQTIQLAARTGKSFVFVHSHPPEFPGHSPQDDREERDLFKAAYCRIHHPSALHASLVFSEPGKVVGRVCHEDGTTEPIDRIRVIGDLVRFIDLHQEAAFDINAFDRQVRAFGKELQELLSRLTVGIVGVGGTGSAVVEQLTRLGLGKLLVCDPQDFEATNVNRVYGSSTQDDGMAKTEIAERNVEHIKTGTALTIVKGDTFDETVVRKLRESDIVFGCTDDEFSRAVLSRLAIYYLIPVFDMGVEIESDNGIIRSARGRVTTFVPASPCAFCRGLVTSDVISAETMSRNNPAEYGRQVKDGYVPELAETAPSVVMFTSTVASTAITEMLHRLSGFMGIGRNSTEVILRFDESKTSTNTKTYREGCWCSERRYWGRGDVQPLLDQTWGATA